MIENLEPIRISQRAATEIRKIMETKNIPPDYGLRVGIRGGGCGASLIIGFDRQKDKDLSYTIAGITVYIDKRHALYIVGKEIDFYEGADAKGFLFTDQPLPS
jgi:iron-sulfur cluster assembly protein